MPSEHMRRLHLPREHEQTSQPDPDSRALPGGDVSGGIKQPLHLGRHRQLHKVQQQHNNILRKVRVRQQNPLEGGVLRHKLQRHRKLHNPPKNELGLKLQPVQVQRDVLAAGNALLQGDVQQKQVLRCHKHLRVRDNEQGACADIHASQRNVAGGLNAYREGS